MLCRTDLRTQAGLFDHWAREEYMVISEQVVAQYQCKRASVDRAYGRTKQNEGRRRGYATVGQEAHGHGGLDHHAVPTQTSKCEHSPGPSQTELGTQVGLFVSWTPAEHKVIAS